MFVRHGHNVVHNPNESRCQVLTTLSIIHVLPFASSSTGKTYP